MFMSRLVQAIQWISGIIWSYLARPFRRTSTQMELPTSSPIPPSTPSFIQSNEPDIAVDAMRIFQLNYGSPRASRIARNKLALKELRDAPQDVNRVVSLCSTDPSPGFSLLNDVVDNIVSIEPNCPSVYSSPPSSPSSSLHTPCIIVSSTMGEIVPESTEGRSGLYLRQDPRIMESDSRADEVSRAELTSQNPRRDIINSTKRCIFKGPPILTNISRDTLLIPPSINNASRDSFHAPPTATRSRSTLATVSDFVRASATHMSPRTVSSREAFMASPELQVAFTENSPFSVHAESFFAEDHISSPSSIDIYDFGIYSDPRSVLNLRPPQRQRNAAERGSHKRSSSSHIAVDPFGKTMALERDPVRGSRLHSFPEGANSADLSVKPRSLTEEDMSSANITDAPALAILSPIASQKPCVETFSVLGKNSDNVFLSPASSDDDQDMSSSLALYASLIFPFSLEDSIFLDDVTHIPCQANDSDNLNLNKDLALDVLAPPDPIEDIAQLFEVEASDFFPSRSTEATLRPPPVRDVTSLDGDLSLEDGSLPLTLACSASDVTPPCRRDSLCVSGTSIHGSILHTTTTAGRLDPASVSSESLSREDEHCKDPPSHAVFSVPTTEGQTSCLSCCLIHDVAQCPGQSAYDAGQRHDIPVLFEPGFHRARSNFSEVIRTSVSDGDNLHALGRASLSAQTISNRRRERRIGIYGGLPSSWAMAPQERKDRSSLISPEQQKGSMMYLTHQDSKRGSLRPLVLPNRLALRESNGDGPKLPPPPVSARRSSIGRPPPFPLPDVPLRKSSSASAVVRLGSTHHRPERFEVLSTRHSSLASQGLGLEEPRSFLASGPVLSSSNEIASDDDDSGHNHTVNWGIAF